MTGAGGDVAGLRRHGERVLVGTGIGVDEVESLITGADTSAVAAALRAGWRAAADPSPAVPRIGTEGARR